MHNMILLPLLKVLYNSNIIDMIEVWLCQSKIILDRLKKCKQLLPLCLKYLRLNQILIMHLIYRNKMCMMSQAWINNQKSIQHLMYNYLMSLYSGKLKMGMGLFRMINILMHIQEYRMLFLIQIHCFKMFHYQLYKKKLNQLLKRQLSLNSVYNLTQRPMSL